MIFKMGKFVFETICRNFTLIFKLMAVILAGALGCSLSVHLFNRRWPKERAAAPLTDDDASEMQLSGCYITINASNLSSSDGKGFSRCAVKIGILIFHHFEV